MKSNHVSEINLQKIDKKAGQPVEVLHEISGIVHITFNNQPKSPFTIDKTKSSSLAIVENHYLYKMIYHAWKKIEEQYW